MTFLATNALGSLSGVSLALPGFRNFWNSLHHSHWLKVLPRHGSFYQTRIFAVERLDLELLLQDVGIAERDRVVSVGQLLGLERVFFEGQVGAALEVSLTAHVFLSKLVLITLICFDVIFRV